MSYQGINNYRYPMQNQVGFAQNNNPVMQGAQGQNNPIMRAVNGEETPESKFATFALTAPMMLGLYKLMELFSHSNNGVYDKSLVGRLANFGDKIAASKYGSASGGFISSIGTKFNQIVDKSKILSALFRMPSKAENGFAKGLLHGTNEQLGQEFLAFVKKYVKNGGKVGDLGGLTDAGLKEIETLLASDSKTVVKSALDKILKICDNVKDSKSVRLDNFLGRLTGRTVTLEQIGNQIRSVTKSKSGLGRFLPKLGIRGMHGITFGGGVFMLLSAFSLAKAAVKAKDTEKGEKFKTFMEEFLSNISWVITMPLSAKIMNAFQGLKNVGLTPAKLTRFRDALKIHNSTVFANKAAWKASADALKALRTPDKLGFLGKIAKGIGSLFSTGREVVKPYINANPMTGADKLSNFFAKSKFFGKNALAYPIGLGIYMLLFSPIAEKIFVKVSHAIFGKPKHSIYDEEPDKKEDVAQNPSSPQQNPIVNPANINRMPDSNLIKRTINGQYIPQSTQYPSNFYNPQQYQPVQYGPTNLQNSANGVNNVNNNNQNDNNKIMEPARSYVPSPVGVVQAGPDTTPADNAIAQADKAEKQIHDIMANLRY